ncbi:MAG: TIGR00299 family protein [Verrucomicrobia bacterium A1]|nr:MAG: TIGR00299 family protein [Verrucomicrobia bacterium A1]
MSVLRFDLTGGASGDMILGALLDLGADRAAIESQLLALGAGAIRLDAARECHHGLTGTRLAVAPGGASPQDLPAGHGHSHGHDHPHGHAHAHGPAAHAAGHAHRSHSDIRAMLEASALPAPARDLALRVFRRLAEAEGRIHGVAADTVTFHEVGALDSIADIVGSCLALGQLGATGIEVGPFPLGRGEVRCAHGVYPLPAPAVVDLLRGMPSVEVDETLETVTPTGAALLVEWAASLPAPKGPRRIVAAGYGFGHHELKGRPNVLRVVRMEPESAEPSAPGECVVLETQVDDSTAEWLGVLVQKLMTDGALDVYTTPVQMKKQRPGTLITVLCETDHREAMLDVLFRNCTTFGVREQTVRRTVLDRRWETVATEFGPVRVKVGLWKGESVTRAPEMDDCIARAAEHGVPPRRVYEAAQRAAP